VPGDLANGLAAGERDHLLACETMITVASAADGATSQRG
jgi:hypothetical protein